MTINEKYVFLRKLSDVKDVHLYLATDKTNGETCTVLQVPKKTTVVKLSMLTIYPYYVCDDFFDKIDGFLNAYITTNNFYISFAAYKTNIETIIDEIKKEFMRNIVNVLNRNSEKRTADTFQNGNNTTKENYAPKYNNSKNEAIYKVAREIEDAYSVMLDPPRIFKGKMSEYIRFENLVEREEYDPSYKVIVHIDVPFTRESLEECNSVLISGKYQNPWHFIGCGYETSQIDLTKEFRGISWQELKKAVIDILSSKYSLWEIRDQGTSVWIKPAQSSIHKPTELKKWILEKMAAIDYIVDTVDAGLFDHTFTCAYQNNTLRVGTISYYRGKSFATEIGRMESDPDFRRKAKIGSDFHRSFVFNEDDDRYDNFYAIYFEKNGVVENDIYKCIDTAFNEYKKNRSIWSKYCIKEDLKVFGDKTVKTNELPQNVESTPVKTEYKRNTTGYRYNWEKLICCDSSDDIFLWTGCRHFEDLHHIVGRKILLISKRSKSRWMPLVNLILKFDFIKPENFYECTEIDQNDEYIIFAFENQEEHRTIEHYMRRLEDGFRKALLN